MSLTLLATGLANAAPVGHPSRPARELEDAADPADAADADPEALTDAIAAYQAKKPQAAAYALHEMLQSKAWPAKEGKIAYFLALSLYDQHLLHGSSHYLVEVLKKGPSEPYFALAMPRLAALAAETGDDSDFARVAARIPAADVPEAARDAAAYERGVRAYEEGDLTRARTELATVAKDSAYFARATYLTGVIFNAQDRLKSAVGAFTTVAKSAGRDEAREKDLSVLDIGRVYYGIERFAEADQWYRNVPLRSDYWPQSIFESGWANFMLNDTDRTLGQLLTLRAPSVAESQFVPEASILAALTWFNLCEYADVDHTLTQFEATYRPMHAEMKAFVKQYATDEGKRLASDAYDRYLGPNPAETTLPKALFTTILRDSDLRTVVTSLRALDDEEALIHAQKSAWRDTVGEDLLVIYAEDRERIKHRGGLDLLRELSATTASLGGLLDQAEIIRFERVDVLRTVYDDIARDPGLLADAGSDPDVSYSISENRVYWPFNGEFWEDELGSYRYAEGSSCR